MQLKSFMLAITTVSVSGLIPISAQAQSYNYNNYDYKNKMCLPTQQLMCRGKKKYRNYSTPRQNRKRSRNRQKPLTHTKGSRCISTPPFYEINGMKPQDYWRQEVKTYTQQPILVEIDGEGRIMTQQKYDALMFKRYVQGAKHLQNFGGNIGYMISRSFTKDPEKQLNAARFGENTFNAISNLPNRNSGQYKTCIRPNKR